MTVASVGETARPGSEREELKAGQTKGEPGKKKRLTADLFSMVGGTFLTSEGGECLDKKRRNGD